MVTLCWLATPDNGPSVQTAIEDAARAFIHAPVAVVGAGRTDAVCMRPVRQHILTYQKNLPRTE